MKNIIEIIGHGMEPERAECMAKEIHKHYMRFVEWIGKNVGKTTTSSYWLVDKRFKNHIELYEYWSNLPENKS